MKGTWPSLRKKNKFLKKMRLRTRIILCCVLGILLINFILFYFFRIHKSKLKLEKNEQTISGNQEEKQLNFEVFDQDFGNLDQKPENQEEKHEKESRISTRDQKMLPFHSEIQIFSSKNASGDGESSPRLEITKKLLNEPACDKIFQKYGEIASKLPILLLTHDKRDMETLQSSKNSSIVQLFQNSDIYFCKKGQLRVFLMSIFSKLSN